MSSLAMAANIAVRDYVTVPVCVSFRALGGFALETIERRRHSWILPESAFLQGEPAEDPTRQAANSRSLGSTRSSKSASEKELANRQGPEDNRADLLPSFDRAAAGASGRDSLAARSRAKPASYHCQPKKRTTAGGVRESACHTNSASGRCASAVAIPCPGCAASDRRAPEQ